MTLFKGLGDAAVRTTDLAGGISAQKLFPYPVYEFSFEQKATSEDAEAYRAGVRVAEETIETKVESILKLKTQISNWSMLGLSLGQLERTLTNFTLPTIKRTTVPAGGVVADAMITATSADSVLAAIERYGAWGQTGPLTRTTLAAVPVRGVKVDGAAGTLTFNAAQVGAPIMYVVDRPVTAANVYGGPGTLAKIGELEFHGAIFDNSNAEADGGLILLPRIQRNTRPTISFSGKLVELETEYKCLIPSGWNEPFMLVDGHTVT